MHLTNSWSETSGGVATFYRALMEAANRRRHSMALVVPGAADCKKNVGEFVRVYEIASPKIRFNSSYRIILPKQFLTYGGRLREILRLEEPELVEINDKYTLIYLGALLRLRLCRDINIRPVVVGLSCERMDVNFHAYLHAVPGGQAFSTWYMRNIYFPFFDHHIAISDPIASELQKAGRGHEIPRCIFKLPMGVDCRLFSPQHRSDSARSGLLRRAQADKGTYLLLYVGRLAPEKNLPLLLDTMEALSSDNIDCRLIIAGDGISRDSLITRARERLGSRVIWLGHIGHREELARLYANCDFFLHPNPREPFGIAPLEAMASGIPLIAPNSGGLQEYANASNSGLTDATGSGFASVICSLIRDNNKRQIMISSALQTARQFSLDAIADRYLNLYQKLVAVAHKELPMEASEPAFVSESPSRTRKAAMAWAAASAASMYSLIASACNRLEINKRGHYKRRERIADSTHS